MQKGLYLLSNSAEGSLLLIFGAQMKCDVAMRMGSQAFEPIPFFHFKEAHHQLGPNYQSIARVAAIPEGELQHAR
jgi:hypothetical protein